MSPVRFTQSIEALVEGVNAPDRALEVGPGNILGGLVKRIARDIPVAGPETPKPSKGNRSRHGRLEES